LEREQARLRKRRVLERLELEVGLTDARRIERLPEYGERLVQLAPHARALRTLAGEHERSPPGLRDAPHLAVAEQDCTVLELSASGGKGVRDVQMRQLRTRLDVS